jgi:xanthine/CO dehydrogenase XdhC/CoxF family maturation factor
VAHALAALLPRSGTIIASPTIGPIGSGRIVSRVTETRTLAAPEALWERLRPSEFTHLYILGYDARKDFEVLRRSLELFPGYIGLIASETKREHLFADLRKAGVVEATLTRVHSPIGLAIGAESPAEIAVSVVAEIVRDRHLTVPRARGKSSAHGTPEHHGVGTA